eukprot:8112663-Ditylum_brightwellii.AAC.1
MEKQRDSTWFAATERTTLLKNITDHEEKFEQNRKEIGQMEALTTLKKEIDAARAIAIAAKF